MKNELAILVLASTSLLFKPALAQAQEPAAAPDAAPAPGPKEEPEEEEAPAPAAAPKTVKAPEPPTLPEVAKAPKGKLAPSVEIYVTVLPFVEYVSPSGPTQRDYAEGPGHVGTATVSYNGVDGPARFRMTSGTSNFGIRGGLPLAEQFKVIAQFETAVALDGDPNPWEADFPNRNSYLGFTGGWGTLLFGMLDTPYKWSTLSTVNPIQGGYVADYTPVIGTPGFLVTAINSVQRWSGSGVSNTSFYRREANSFQYWSPTVAGFYLRASYTMNEFRTSEEKDANGMLYSPETNPYMLSVAAGFDFKGLRLRYALENHHDYFGLGYISGVTAPAVEIRTSDDWGNKVVAQYTLTINPDIKTRLVGIGEYLKYTLSADLAYPDIVSGKINSYERPAFYALVEQTIFRHHIWAAYGHAYSGKCTRVPNPDGSIDPCHTTHVGAQYLMAGYMFAFNDNAKAFLMGYDLINERSALYVTSPALAREGLSPGYDQLGVGLGFYYSFGAALLN